MPTRRAFFHTAACTVVRARTVRHAVGRAAARHAADDGRAGGALTRASRRRRSHGSSPRRDRASPSRRADRRARPTTAGCGTLQYTNIHRQRAASRRFYRRVNANRAARDRPGEWGANRSFVFIARPRIVVITRPPSRRGERTVEAAGVGFGGDARTACACGWRETGEGGGAGGGKWREGGGAGGGKWRE